ncbi:MAG: GntR family transcriptional regulator [Firmicutes bacterium]|nr:GntR family transcriptional regulator [Bacillota bacterium]
MANEYRIRPREAAAEQIECYILEHELTAHAKLPSEREMYAMWGINRTTLRSAIRRLIEEGVLYNRMGSGTFVSPPKLTRNLQDIKGFSSVARSAGHVVSSRMVRLGVREASKQIAQKMHLTLGHKVLEIVRVRIIDQVPVLLETVYLDTERCKGIETYDLANLSLYSILEKDYGIRITQGVENLNVTYTDKEEAELLEIPEGTPVFYQTGVVFDDQGVPVEYFKSIARSDYIRFASELTR